MSLPNCTICREVMTDVNVVRTVCAHLFHKACLSTWLKKSNTCPQCRAVCSMKDCVAVPKSTTGVMTRQQANQNSNTGDIQDPCTSQQARASLGTQQNADTSDRQSEIIIDRNSPEQEEARIRNLVTAVITARQTSMLEEMENNMIQRVEQRLDNIVSNLMQQLSLRTQENTTDRVASTRNTNVEATGSPYNNARLNSPLTNQFHRQIDDIQFSEAGLDRNIGRIAQLIKSWDIKFDGSSKLSVESFICRLESQVIDTLGGNFNCLCEHIQSLLVGDAKDWYWGYRRTVNRITWPAFCEALRVNFEEHRTDTEIKDLVRNRKQGHNETFDEYRNAVYKLMERLTNPFPENELVEIMQRGLRPKIRQQLLYVPIVSIAELRRLCLKGEKLLNELSKNQQLNPTHKFIPHRNVNEIDLGDMNLDPAVEEEDINEVRVAKALMCWNCRQPGHRYMDCLEKRTVFCYGCGAINVYKPTCVQCNAGNAKRSEMKRTLSRQDQQ